MTNHTARRTPVHRGPAAWNAILDPQPAPRLLETHETADVVIIGAGFAGLSAARRLTQLDPAARITLVDAGRIAEGAAGRNSGFMIDLPHDLASDNYAGAGNDQATTRLNRQAIAFARAAVDEYGIDPAYFDPSGKVNGAVSTRAQQHNRDYAAHLGRMGETHEHLDAQQMFDLTGSRYYGSGLFTPGTVTLQPAGYVRGLARGLAAKITLYENTPVTGFEKQTGGWKVTTERGTISAGKIILSVNGHLESFGFARGRLLQVFLFASMTPDLDAATLQKLGGRPRWGVTPSDPMGTTMRRIDGAQGGNRVITRTCAVLRPGLQSKPGDLARAANMHQRKFDQRYPQLAGLKMEHSWAGHLCLSLNGVSVTGALDAGVYAACVQNGLGTARGTLTGIAAAEDACNVTSDITAHFSAEPAPRKLVPQPFAEIGANAVMRWKEWRATRE